MGIERKESVVVTYKCDRCEKQLQAFNELSTPVDAPEGWVDVKIALLAGFGTPVRRVVCDGCTIELKGWFAQLGTVV